MEKGLYVALSGAVAESKALDLVAHNVANASTTGFSPSRGSFAEVLSRAESGSRGGSSRQVKLASISPDQAPGRLEATAGPLDLALDGPGYLPLSAPHGVAYTRSASFRVGPEGLLIDGRGYALLDRQGNSISIPEGASVSVASDGTVSADGEPVAEIAVHDFPSEVLSLVGELWKPNEGFAPANAEETQVLSGSLEKPSFNVIRGMVELVQISRSFEALTKMIETHREIDRRTAQDLGNG